MDSFNIKLKWSLNALNIKKILVTDSIEVDLYLLPMNLTYCNAHGTVCKTVFWEIFLHCFSVSHHRIQLLEQRNTSIGFSEPVSVEACASFRFPRVNRSSVPTRNIYYTASAHDKPQHARLQRLMGLHHMGLHIASIHLAWRCVFLFLFFFFVCFVSFLMKYIDVSTWQTYPLNSQTPPIHQKNREREEEKWNRFLFVCCPSPTPEAGPGLKGSCLGPFRRKANVEDSVIGPRGLDTDNWQLNPRLK